MRSSKCRPILAAIFCLGLLAAVSAEAQQNQAQPNEEAQTASRPLRTLPFVLLPDKPSLEPKALAILKAASDKLAVTRPPFALRLSMLRAPAPNATIWSSPPAIITFLRKWII